MLSRCLILLWFVVCLARAVAGAAERPVVTPASTAWDRTASGAAPAGSYQAPIADVRKEFARKASQTPEDEARTRAFIDGKIDMIRRDPRMTEAEKAAAIAELNAKR